MNRIVLHFVAFCLALAFVPTNTLGTIKASAESEELNLKDFGAVGDGVADDGPALQKALDALAAAGGGTLFVPAGKYSISTPVLKDFTGLASSIAIRGVESLTPVAPPSAPGSELSKGLDLLSEIYPRTGPEQNAITIVGLRSLGVKDIAFVGTQTVATDAAVTLLLSDIEKAQIKHSEFYGLASLVPGGGIVKAVRSDLEITQCKFLGSIATSGWYVPVVENIDWRGITVSDTTFLDYGQRADFFGKSGLAAPIAWINIGNAAPVDNHSPRREVVIRNVFLDEGGYWGLSSLPYRYAQSAPIDLIYVTGLQMNVSNFDQFGHQLYDTQRVFIEKSRYGWSRNAAAAVALNNIGAAILDQLTCEADADHIYADSSTREVTVINSTYAQLDSSAQKTNTINTTDEDDPVQYVRARFADVLGREPDAAAHFYWSDLLIRCFADAECQAATKQALNDYLSAAPSPTFGISGRITDEHGSAVAGVRVTLSGSQSVAANTDAEGNYSFTNLPTSGRYVITPSKDEYIFNAASQSFIAPAADRTANFTAKPSTYVVKGRITSGESALAGVLVTVTGSATASAIADSAGEYSFKLGTEGSYTLTPTKAHYTFAAASSSINDLNADAQFDFSATLSKHSITGRVRNGSGEPLAGVVVTLSGSLSSTTTTTEDGAYSFTSIEGGTNCTVTAAKDGYGFLPAVLIFNDLAADSTADFLAVPPPRLLTIPDSDRAVALELTQLVPEPFPLTASLLSDGRNRTRIMVFATNLNLLPGEDVAAFTAEAEDAAHVRYPLRVEFVTPLPEFPHITQIVLRLNRDMEAAGEVLVSVTVHGLTTNRVRIAIEP